jgi:hypothetical protein
LTEPFFATELYDAVTASQEFGWPKFLDVNFRDTWQWLIQSEALIAGVGVDIPM